MMAGNMTIGAFAEAADVNVETIRFYQRRGLITAPPRPFGTVRRYDSSDVSRVRFIKRAQGLGFSLAEVAGLLELEDGAHCRESLAIAREKLTDVRHKLADLRRIERALDTLMRRCDTTEESVRCPLIAALHDDSRTRRGA